MRLFGVDRGAKRVLFARLNEEPLCLSCFYNLLTFRLSLRFFDTICWEKNCCEDSVSLIYKSLNSSRSAFFYTWCIISLKFAFLDRISFILCIYSHVYVIYFFKVDILSLLDRIQVYITFNWVYNFLFTIFKTPYDIV